MRKENHTSLLWNDGGKGRQEDHSTPVAYTADVHVGQSSCLSWEYTHYTHMTMVGVKIG